MKPANNEMNTLLLSTSLTDHQDDDDEGFYSPHASVVESSFLPPTEEDTVRRKSSAAVARKSNRKSTNPSNPIPLEPAQPHPFPHLYPSTTDDSDVIHNDLKRNSVSSDYYKFSDESFRNMVMSPHSRDVANRRSKMSSSIWAILVSLSSVILFLFGLGAIALSLYNLISTGISVSKGEIDTTGYRAVYVVFLFVINVLTLFIHLLFISVACCGFCSGLTRSFPKVRYVLAFSYLIGLTIFFGFYFANMCAEFINYYRTYFNQVWEETSRTYTVLILAMVGSLFSLCCLCYCCCICIVCAGAQIQSIVSEGKYQINLDSLKFVSSSSHSANS